MQLRFYHFLCLSGLILFINAIPHDLFSQPSKYYWQQRINYKMDVNLDVNTNQFKGHQVIRYKNNSPDKLDRVFFHLYLNAFQPESEMDVRSRTIPDPDSRVGERILHLDFDEIGYQKIKQLSQNGTSLNFEVNGTILEVTLAKPILPGKTATFEMEYEAQVPLQVRRNGRDNKEGIRYSMSQWYPKMCEYDEKGWHADPYVAREFYGVWGDFDVSLTLNADYVVAATGVLQNSKLIGHGYAPEPKQKTQMLTWHFIAQNVHDFVWAADPDFIHNVHRCDDGLMIHTFYQETSEYSDNWKALPGIMEEAFRFINTHYGKYPYPVYSFIQGGDGGMEYPMATLITGNRSLRSLVGVSVHELLHSWYQMVLGFDESHYYWMDEGFTDYVEIKVTEHLKSKNLIPGELIQFPYEDTYASYANLVEQGIEEPLSTHADHFNFNSAYSIAAYVKGSVFLNQLEYVVGKDVFDKGMIDFFNAWKFKHPDDNDLIRVMENASGLELDWYKEYMIYSTKTIDYAVDSLYSENDKSIIRLIRVSKMPMPVDVAVKMKDGSVMNFTIPLDLMRGAKRESLPDGSNLVVLKDWNWVNPTYEFELNVPKHAIDTIIIDQSLRLADINRADNIWPVSKS
ncbi:MAG TPA: M1 family metallopeptidase [Saprospiraceae bacterium]|nr:M1 family metallopeptidase [Saprospiraceae bacterium]